MAQGTKVSRLVTAGQSWMGCQEPAVRAVGCDAVRLAIRGSGPACRSRQRDGARHFRRLRRSSIEESIVTRARLYRLRKNGEQRTNSRAELPQGLKPLTDFAAVTAPFDYAQGRLKVVPFQVSSNLQSFSAACLAGPQAAQNERGALAPAGTPREDSPLVLHTSAACLEHFHYSYRVGFVVSHPFHKEREKDGARSFLTPSVKMPAPTERLSTPQLRSWPLSAASSGRIFRSVSHRRAVFAPDSRFLTLSHR